MAKEHPDAPIHLVFTDVVMPLLGGKLMAERLKITYPGLKILYTSGYAGEAVAQLGISQPGVAFLPKPITPGVLARKVRELLDEARA